MDRDSLVYKAKLCEQTDRFDDMLSALKEVAKQPQELENAEMRDLSFAFSKAITPLRCSWRSVTTIERERERSGESANNMTIIKDHKVKIGSELSEMSNGILSITDEFLIPNSSSPVAKVFSHTLKGDCHQYLAGIQQGDTSKASASSALDAYKSATEMASALAPDHPIRLGLALNYSTFYYEILQDLDSAAQICNKTFDDAKYGEVNEEANVILCRIKDNLKLWTDGYRNH